MPAHRVPPSAESLAQVAACAESRRGVFGVRDALVAGVTPSQIRTLVRRGEWVSLGRGALGISASVTGSEHLHRCRARLEQIGRDAVVSHASAAVLHGFLYVNAPGAPTLSVPRLEHVEHLDGLLSSRLPDDHVVEMDGIRVTTPARTLVDLLRGAVDHYEAQAIADGAARIGLDRAAVAGVLDDCTGWPGIAQARTAWAQSDGRMESPLESRNRLWFREGGLPDPEPQVVISDRYGREVARVDFLFREQRTVVESDGRVKYDDPYRNRDDPRRVLWTEKVREDDIRETGLEVVRSTWADRRDRGAALVARVQRAFARAARRRSA